jgi:hypothetical protein
LDIAEYESVKKWFAFRSKPYAPSTKKEYIEYMTLWCRLTGKNPDEIANGDIDELRGIIASGMRELGLAIRSVTDRTNALNGFWRANGRHFKETYGGIPKQLRKDIERAVKRTAN